METKGIIGDKLQKDQQILHPEHSRDSRSPKPAIVNDRDLFFEGSRLICIIS